MAFGNSCYENSVPWFQPTMFATGGENTEITSERKKVVDGKIWKVVTGHPYTRRSDEQSPKASPSQPGDGIRGCAQIESPLQDNPNRRLT